MKTRGKKKSNVRKPLPNHSIYGIIVIGSRLHAGENFLAIGGWGRTVDLQNGKTLRLRGGAVLANRNLVTFSETEARRRMRRDVPMALFESLVLTNPMQVIAADDDSLLHFGGHNHATK